jgi:hypothetical protein
MAKEFDFASGKRPDLVCFDNRTLQPKQGDPPTRLLVVEFKRPGVKISSKELQQVMLYKNVFESALADISSDDIDVMILGDAFDPAFDRKAVAYKIVSYEELLANARDRYRELYERLAPEGVPALAKDVAEGETAAASDGKANGGAADKAAQDALSAAAKPSPRKL